MTLLLKVNCSVLLVEILNEDRTIEKTMDIGWDILSTLPEREMKRVKRDFIEKYGKWRK